MHAVERELIKITKFKPRKKYADRQDYLRSILVATSQLDDNEYNELTDEAAAWCDVAVRTFNENKEAELPDFDEVDDDDFKEASTEDDTDDESDDADDTADDDDDADDTDTDDDDLEGSDEEPAEAMDDTVDEPSEDSDAEDLPDDEGNDTDEAEDEAEEDEAELQLEEAALTPKQAKAEKPKTPLQKAREKEVAARKAKKAENAAKVKAALEKGIKKNAKPPELLKDAELDKWGCILGSKNSQALAMFEKGATTREVADKIGGTYYNILKRKVEEGHKLIKDGSLFTITHKDGDKAKPRKLK